MYLCLSVHVYTMPDFKIQDDIVGKHTHNTTQHTTTQHSTPHYRTAHRNTTPMLTNLIYIELRNGHITEEVIHALSLLPQLVSLKLWECNIFEDTECAMLSVGCPTLKSLVIAFLSLKFSLFVCARRVVV